MPKHFEFVGFDPHELKTWRRSYPTPLTNFIVDRPCCIIVVGAILIAVVTIFVFQFNMFAVTPANNRMYLILSD